MRRWRSGLRSSKPFLFFANGSSSMSQKRTEMIQSLQELVVPLLRERGFKGSFPHFRRAQQSRLDLVSFQFHRFGGEFVIEIAQCDLAALGGSPNKNKPPQKLRCWDLHPKQ